MRKIGLVVSRVKDFLWYIKEIRFKFEDQRGLLMLYLFFNIQINFLYYNRNIFRFCLFWKFYIFCSIFCNLVLSFILFDVVFVF